MPEEASTASTTTVCPHCGQTFEVMPELVGRRALCECCGEHFVVSISSAGVAGGAETSAEVLAGLASRSRYEIGEMVARGGMGGILAARDVHIRRSVAMKVMLSSAAVADANLVRFVEEAQLTGQLEHPNIVPIYELGVDGAGKPYYAMRFVQGVTLKQVLEKIRDGDPETIASHPLAYLLTIFQKTCDAVAFAHSKGVIHRDLKPENIMVGEFGEVYLMDWGLAKVLGGRNAADVARSGQEVVPAVSSLRQDAVADDMHTMTGAVMGTPQFMAPEQALGKIDELDARTDVYALGAILYTILALRPPVEGDSVRNLLLKVARGDVTNLTDLNPSTASHSGTSGGPPKRIASAVELSRRATQAKQRLREQQVHKTPFPHLPHHRIPAALAAVAMKALALEPKDRYQHVKDLQADIERYESGFATAAEEAGLARQLLLLVKRHRGFVAAAALVVVALAVGLAVALAQWREAEAQRRLAEFAQSQAESSEEKAVAALSRAERENYRNIIALASRKIDDGEILQAEKMLWNTPVAFRGWEWGCCMYLCHADLLALEGHVKWHRVWSIAFMPGGRRLVSGSSDGTIRLWDVTNGEGQEILQPGYRVHTVAVSPDGALLAASGDAGDVRVWDSRTRRLLYRAEGGKRVAFSPSGKMLASTGRRDGNAFVPGAVWDAKTGKNRVAMPKGASGTILLWLDEQTLVTAGPKGVIEFWTVSRDGGLSPKTSLSVDPRQNVFALSASPDGKRLALGGSSQVIVCDAVTGTELKILKGHQGHVFDVEFSPDGTSIVSAGADGTIGVWDLGTGLQKRVIRAKSPLNAIALFADGRRVAAAGNDSLIRIWDLDLGLENAEIPGQGYCVGFTHDGRHVLQGLTLYDVHTGRAERTITESLPGFGGISAAAMSADGSRLALGRSNGQVLVLDSASGTLRLNLSSGEERIWAVAFSPVGQQLAIASGKFYTRAEDARIAILEADTGKERLRLAGHDHVVSALAFFPDGKRVATGGYDGTARIWDVGTGRELICMQTGTIRSLCPSPDGRHLATGGDYAVGCIWDAATGEELLRLEGHPDRITAIAYAPDGRRIATSSKDHTLRIWDAGTGDELLVLAEAPSYVLSFSADGNAICTADHVFHAFTPQVTPERIADRQRARYRRWLQENQSRGNEDKDDNQPLSPEAGQRPK